jgi:hypothetical protein
MEILNKPTSFNKLILQAYVHTEIRPDGNKGWIQAGQKNSLKGLKVLMNAKFSDGTIVLKDSTAYIKEDSLHTSVWAKDKRKCDTLSGEFILVTMNEVEYISPPEGGVA